MYELKRREPGSANREGFNTSDVMYLIMPDRFANGDPGNDEIAGMPDPLNMDDDFGRHGGDIQGMIDHLDYISGMGYTAIWLNPILENNGTRASYHGYATTDYYKIDARFGSNEEFREFCSRANEMGIKIIQDMIFNHCGISHWWMEDLPSGDWINFHPQEEFIRTTHNKPVNMDPYASEYDRKMMVDGWFSPGMPDLNQRNPYMAKYLIQNSIWWIEYAGLAGIRQDTYPYPDKEMMADWNKLVLEEYPQFNIVGEEWVTNPGIVAYWQKGQINRDGYQGFTPSLMDFPLQNALSRSLTEREGRRSGWHILYSALANDFLYPDPFNLVIFPDNHDMPRFYMQVGMDQDLYKLGITYILTTRGVPQIFYGSEILMTHTESNSHGAIRKDFPGGWEGDRVNGFTGENLTEDEKAMQAFFRKLLHWRKDNLLVQKGKLIHYLPEGGVYVLGRYIEDDRLMIVLNQDEEDVTLKLDRYAELIGSHTSGRDVISGKAYELGEELQVPALTPLVLELGK